MAEPARGETYAYPRFKMSNYELGYFQLFELDADSQFAKTRDVVEHTKLVVLAPLAPVVQLTAFAHHVCFGQQLFLFAGCAFCRWLFRGCFLRHELFPRLY